MLPTPLASAPLDLVDASGAPRLGTYVGELPSVDFGRLRGAHAAPLPKRFVSQKRWVYTVLATPEVMAVVAIVDLGYTANAFVSAVDLIERRVLADDSFLGLPGPLARVGDAPSRGLSAHFRTLGARFALHRSATDERLSLEATVLGLRSQTRHAVRLRAQVLVEGGPPPLGVIAPVPGGGVNVTQKCAGLLSFGTLLAGGRAYGLDGGVAGTDYTQGLLPRKTAWRWAMAVGRLSDGTPVGVNVVEGFNEAEGVSENAAWVGGRILPLGRAVFRFRRDDPLEPWHVRTDDGALELEFRPIHVHREARDLVLVKSRFVQPLGHFSGTLRVDGRTIALERLAGVTEDQDVLW